MCFCLTGQLDLKSSPCGKKRGDEIRVSVGLGSSIGGASIDETAWYN